MRDLNKVQIIGHLGHDPDVRYLDNGTALTTFNVATHHSYANRRGPPDRDGMASRDQLGQAGGDLLAVSGQRRTGVRREHKKVGGIKLLPGSRHLLR